MERGRPQTPASRRTARGPAAQNPDVGSVTRPRVSTERQAPSRRFVSRDTPGHTGHPDFDTADASSGDSGPQLSPGEVFKKMIRNPVILTILSIEFCSGFMRNAIMQWYPKFAKATGIAKSTA